MSLSEKIKSLKSAELITDPIQIRKALNDEQRVAHMKSTTFSQKSGDDQTDQVRKMVGKMLPALSPGENVQELAEARGITWTDDMKDRVVPYWGSDERIDSDGDLVMQEWDFTIFEDNSVMPYSHRWGDPPIGKAIDFRVLQRKDDKYEGLALYILGLFATEEMSPFAEHIFRLVKSGFLPAISMGFYPQTVINVTDEEERQELGLGRWGYILGNNMLLEASPTTLPANSGALRITASMNKAKQKDGLTAEDFNVLRELIRQEKASKDASAWREEDRAWAKAIKNVYSDVEVLESEPDTIIFELGLDPDTETSANDEPESGAIEALSARVEELAEQNKTLLSRFDKLLSVVEEGFSTHSVVLAELQESIDDKRLDDETAELTSLDDESDWMSRLSNAMSGKN